MAMTVTTSHNSTNINLGGLSQPWVWEDEIYSFRAAAAVTFLGFCKIVIQIDGTKGRFSINNRSFHWQYFRRQNWRASAAILHLQLSYRA